MKVVSLLLWMKSAQGFASSRRVSQESLTEDFSIMKNYYSLYFNKDKDQELKVPFDLNLSPGSKFAPHRKFTMSLPPEKSLNPPALTEEEGYESESDGYDSDLEDRHHHDDAHPAGDTKLMDSDEDSTRGSDFDPSDTEESSDIDRRLPNKDDLSVLSILENSYEWDDMDCVTSDPEGYEWDYYQHVHEENDSVKWKDMDESVIWMHLDETQSTGWEF